MDDEPTLPNLGVHKPDAAPGWPLPQPPRAEARHIWGGVLLLAMVALVSFGVVWGTIFVLGQHDHSITVPSQPTNSPSVPPVPTATPTRVPTATSSGPSATPVTTPAYTPLATETAQPTPTSGGG